MPASAHLHRSVPSYYENFQDALDNLSEQIVSCYRCSATTSRVK